jgi:hypothetical protein
MAAAGTALVTVAGCSSSSTPLRSSAESPTAISSDARAPSAAIGRQNIRSTVGHTVQLGRKGESIFASVLAAPPTFSRKAFTPKAPRPAHNFYVTVRITLTNKATEPLLIQPVDFWVMPGNVSVIGGVRPPAFRSISLESVTSSERAGVSF